MEYDLDGLAVSYDDMMMMMMVMMMMMMMMFKGWFTRMLQVPNIVRRLADADNLPCRIGQYSHHDDDDDFSANFANHFLYITG